MNQDNNLNPVPQVPTEGTPVQPVQPVQPVEQPVQQVPVQPVQQASVQPVQQFQQPMQQPMQQSFDPMNQQMMQPQGNNNFVKYIALVIVVVCVVAGIYVAINNNSGSSSSSSKKDRNESKENSNNSSSSSTSSSSTKVVEDKNVPTVDENGDLDFKPIVIYDKNGITLTASSLNKSSSGYKIGFTLENNTKDDIYASTEMLTVNNYVVGGSVYMTAEAGATVTDSEAYYTSYLGFDEEFVLRYFDVQFTIRDKDNYAEGVKTDIYRINTDQFNTKYELETEKTVFSKNDIKLDLVNINTSSSYSTYIYFAFFNDSNKMYDFTIKDCKVDGVEVSCYSGHDLYSGYIGIDDVSLYSSYFDDISNIKKLSFTLEVSDDDYNKIVDEVVKVDLQ